MVDRAFAPPSTTAARRSARSVSAASLAELIQLVETAKITGAVGKKVFAKMFETGRGAAEMSKPKVGRASQQ